MERKNSAHDTGQTKKLLYSYPQCCPSSFVNFPNVWMGHACLNNSPHQSNTSSIKAPHCVIHLSMLDKWSSPQNLDTQRPRWGRPRLRLPQFWLGEGISALVLTRTVTRHSDPARTEPWTWHQTSIGLIHCSKRPCHVMEFFPVSHVTLASLSPMSLSHWSLVSNPSLQCGITDEDLVTLSVRDLNRQLKMRGLNRDEIVQMKQR